VLYRITYALDVEKNKLRVFASMPGKAYNYFTRNSSNRIG
jgi:hypothetical protein